MAAEINIDKKTVSAFLAAGKVRQYLIPEYQRPYAWTDDQIVTLFDDIWEFATTIGGFNNEQATYFLKYHHQAGFADAFRSFLKRLVSFLLIRYLERPTISAVKGDVLKLDSAIMESPKPAFASTLVERNELRSHIVEPHSKVLRMLLKILAYNRQTELLPAAWDVEHIFPQHWENGYFPNLSDEYVRGRVEHLGNKVPFETVKNIKASNGFFSKKKDLYKTSKIAIVRELVEFPQWNLDEIAYRDGHVSDVIFNTLESWIMTYDNPHNPVEK